MSRLRIVVLVVSRVARRLRRVRPAGLHHRHRDGRIEGRAAGRQRDRHRPGRRPELVAVTNEKGRVPAAEHAAGQVHRCRRSSPASRRVMFKDVELLVGQNATIPFTMKLALVSETLTVIGETPLVDTHVVAGRRQRRPPPDGAAAAPGPQLDGAVEAGEGRHRERRRQQHRHRRDGRPVAAESRRPADHAEGRRLRVRPAEVQPRVDRRVPDRHQHVRHHPGALGRHGDPGDLQVGHQHTSAAAPTATSAATR